MIHPPMIARVSSNLPALGVRPVQFSPGWAIGCWFVPIANFIWPYRAMTEICRRSEPDFGTTAEPEPLPEASGWLQNGWFFWVAYWLSIYGFYVSLYFGDSIPLIGRAIGFVPPCYVFAGYYLVRTILDINQRQVARNENILERIKAKDPAFTMPDRGAPEFVS